MTADRERKEISSDLAVLSPARSLVVRGGLEDIRENLAVTLSRSNPELERRSKGEVRIQSSITCAEREKQLTFWNSSERKSETCWSASDSRKSLCSCGDGSISGCGSRRGHTHTHRSL